MTRSKTLASLALAAALAVASVACDVDGGRNGRRPSGAHATTGSETPWVAGFLDPGAGEQAVQSLFEVETDDPEYWRMFTLDRYDGELWTSTETDGPEGGVSLSPPARLPPPRGTRIHGGETLVQTFRILSDFDSAHALPMAQTAVEITGTIGDITWDPARSGAFVDGQLEAGMEYTVRSRILVPTPEELDGVDHLAPRKYGQWTELPAELDPRIGEIAERWTADETSSYRKVLAIQQHFHNGDFAYSTNVQAADDGDSLLEFLTQTKVGFCQHYTSAMTVMVRELGLPARIAVGYRSGTREEDGDYLVKTKDAHVWVEVLFPGYGWLQFEPEPGPIPHPNAQPGTYLNPIAATDLS